MARVSKFSLLNRTICYSDRCVDCFKRYKFQTIFLPACSVYFKMSSKRDTIIDINVETYPRDEIIDLYTKLASEYRRLKEESELSKQELHHRKQQTKLLQQSQSDLQNELDGINETYKAETDAIMKINNGIIESLKKSKQEIESDKSLLETKLDVLTKHLNEQELEIKVLRDKIVNKKPAPRISDSFSINLEIEIESLKESQIQVCGKLEGEIKKSQEKNLQIEELRERILCLEDNLESKKSEIEEKNESMESLHEQLNEMTVEIALLKTAPDESSKLKTL